MAEAAINPIVTTATQIIKDAKGFSREHRVRHSSYIVEKDRILDRITDARTKLDVELADTEEDTLYMLRNQSNTALKEYYKAIDNHAETSWTSHPLQKVKRRRDVKRKERQVRDSNEALRDFEDMVSSAGSDISSVYAASGSPPGSRESVVKVEDWRGNSTEELEDNNADETGQAGDYPTVCHPVQVGETLFEGRYVVVCQLGSSHTTTKWLVDDTQLNRRTVLESAEEPQDDNISPPSQTTRTFSFIDTSSPGITFKICRKDMSFVTRPFRGLFGAGPSHRRKQRLFNVDRKAICQYHEDNPTARQEDIASRYGIERATVSKLLKHKAKWLNIGEVLSSKQRPIKFPEIEEQMVMWLSETTILLTDNAIRLQAKAVARDLGVPEDRFKASSGWVENFKHRHGIRGGVWKGKHHDLDTSSLPPPPHSFSSYPSVFQNTGQNPYAMSIDVPFPEEPLPEIDTTMGSDIPCPEPDNSYQPPPTEAQSPEIPTVAEAKDYLNKVMLYINTASRGMLGEQERRSLAAVMHALK